jgi:hypothetical protein
MHTIYFITNTTTGKVIVGRTGNYPQRCGVHECDLRHNRHANKELQSDYNALGAEHFEFQILEAVETKEEAMVAEQAWIKAFPDVYNRERSPEIRKRRLGACARACTVDGITIYESKKALAIALGCGGRGLRSSTFRYV